MNNIKSLRNKDFTDLVNNIPDQNLKEVAIVSVCLCEEHDKCTGSYIDYTKTYSVKCACSCHNYKSNLKGDK
jgi:hypothetical protein